MSDKRSYPLGEQGPGLRSYQHEGGGGGAPVKATAHTRDVRPYGVMGIGEWYADDHSDLSMHAPPSRLREEQEGSFFKRDVPKDYACARRRGRHPEDRVSAPGFRCASDSLNE